MGNRQLFRLPRAAMRLSLWLLALFLVAVGAKFWLIHVYGSEVPYHDDWTGAVVFLKPWVEGNPHWQTWIEPHNEHRIFFTRLLNLICIQLDGGWNPLVQMAIDALLHAAAICGLVYWLWVCENRKDQGVLCLLLAPFLALPFAAENTLWSIQSQVYFMLFMGGATIVGLGFHRPGSRGWLLGLAAAVGSLFTTVSGMMAPLAVVGLVGLRALQQRRIKPEERLTAACCLAVVATGLGLLMAAGHQTAHSWRAIAAALVWILAWPFENKPTMLVFTCLPLGIMVVKYFRGGFKDSQAAEFLLALGLWEFLQAGAIAYGRSDAVNCSRYLDVFSIIPMASLASLFILGEGGLGRGISRGWLTVLAVGWAAIMLGGIWNVSPRNWRNYEDGDNYPLWFKQTMLVQEEDIRGLVSNGLPELVPHDPDRYSLTNMLGNPKFSNILPALCRPPLKIEKGEGSDDAFIRDGYSPTRPKQEFTQAWGNYTTNGIRPGRFVSQPITAQRSKLELQLCCMPDAKDVRIELVEQGTGKRSAIKPRATNCWQTVTVDAPQSPFRLEITDESPRSWVAVGTLREDGRISEDTRYLLAYGPLILVAGLFLFMVLAGYDAFRGATELHSSRAIRWAVLAAAGAAFFGVWQARDFDAKDLKCELYAHLAKGYAASGHFTEARRLLNEALWLEPDNAKVAGQLSALPDEAKNAGR